MQSYVITVSLLLLILSFKDDVFLTNAYYDRMNYSSRLRKSFTPSFLSHHHHHNHFKTTTTTTTTTITTIRKKNFRVVKTTTSFVSIVFSRQQKRNMLSLSSQSLLPSSSSPTQQDSICCCPPYHGRIVVTTYPHHGSNTKNINGGGGLKTIDTTTTIQTQKWNERKNKEGDTMKYNNKQQQQQQQQKIPVQELKLPIKNKALIHHSIHPTNALIRQMIIEQQKQQQHQQQQRDNRNRCLKNDNNETTTTTKTATATLNDSCSIEENDNEVVTFIQEQQRGPLQYQCPLLSNSWKEKNQRLHQKQTTTIKADINTSMQQSSSVMIESSSEITTMDVYVHHTECSNNDHQQCGCVVEEKSDEKSEKDENINSMIHFQLLRQSNEDFMVSVARLCNTLQKRIGIPLKKTKNGLQHSRHKNQGSEIVVDDKEESPSSMEPPGGITTSQSEAMDATTPLLWEIGTDINTGKDILLKSIPLDGIKNIDLFNFATTSMDHDTTNRTIDSTEQNRIPMVLTVPVPDDNTLHPDDQKRKLFFFRIEWNRPIILSVRTFENFGSCLFSSIPITITIQTLYTTSCIVSWYVNEKLVQQSLSTTCQKDDADKGTSSHYLTHASFYVPTIDDIDHELIVLITPINENVHNYDHGGGCQHAYRFVKTIEPLPSNTILQLRSEWLRTSNIDYHTPTDSTKKFRVMTYNILAHQNAITTTGMPFYPYVSKDILTKEHRMPLILHEIITNQSDIICLQEVDEIVFTTLLEPTLRIIYHYQGYYTNKKGTGTKEGCAMFWSLNTFHTVDMANQKAYSMKQLLRHVDDHEATAATSIVESNVFEKKKGHAEDETDHHHHDWDSGLRELVQVFQHRPDLRYIFDTRLGHIVQMVPLVPKNHQAPQGTDDNIHTMDNNNNNNNNVKNNNSVHETTIWVTNTHLFYHPRASHIRLIQIYLLCRQLHEEMEARLSQLCHQQPNHNHFILCGDFNSSYNNSACKLLLDRMVPMNYRDNKWHYNDYRWNEKSKQQQDVTATENSNSSTSPNHDDNHNNVEKEFQMQQGNKYNYDFPSLSLPSSFPYLQSAISPMPMFTHYIDGFQAALDFIFIGTKEVSLSSSNNNNNNNIIIKEQLNVQRSAPMPTKEHVTVHTAMPSLNIPSDHVSLICDLELS